MHLVCTCNHFEVTYKRETAGRSLILGERIARKEHGLHPRVLNKDKRYLLFLFTYRWIAIHYAHEDFVDMFVGPNSSRAGPGWRCVSKATAYPHRRAAGRSRGGVGVER